MTRARASLNPVQFSGSFIRHAWSVRSTLTAEEHRGLFQFLYVTACSSVEAILSEYMAAVLHWPAATLDTTKLFPERSRSLNDGSSISLDQTLMNESVHRLLERTAHELAAAPFARLMDLHPTILGTKPREKLGPQLYGAILGIVAIRNLFAHSRSVYVDLTTDPAGTGYLLPESNFDTHPLKPAFQALGEAGLYNAQAAKRHDGLVELLLHIYREDVLLFFWCAAAEAVESYLNSAASGGFIDAQTYDRLPTLAA